MTLITPFVRDVFRAIDDGILMLSTASDFRVVYAFTKWANVWLLVCVAPAACYSARLNRGDFEHLLLRRLGKLHPNSVLQQISGSVGLVTRSVFPRR